MSKIVTGTLYIRSLTEEPLSDADHFIVEAHAEDIVGELAFDTIEEALEKFYGMAETGHLVGGTKVVLRHKGEEIAVATIIQQEDIEDGHDRTVH